LRVKTLAVKKLPSALKKIRNNGGILMTASSYKSMSFIFTPENGQEDASDRTVMARYPNPFSP